MTRRAIWTAGVTLLLASATVAFGQRLTEMYIPIGQSPGLSGKHTFIGAIGAVDAGSRLVTCVHASGTATMKVTDRTRIWLDRSRAKQANGKGTLADLVVGRRMETKYVGNERKPGGEAEWIKVEPSAGDAR